MDLILRELKNGNLNCLLTNNTITSSYNYQINDIPVFNFNLFNILPIITSSPNQDIITSGNVNIIVKFSDNSNIVPVGYKAYYRFEGENEVSVNSGNSVTYSAIKNGSFNIRLYNINYMTYSNYITFQVQNINKNIGNIPIPSVDNIERTNQPVIVTVEYDENALTKEYAIEEEKQDDNYYWYNYTGPITISSNCTIIFRSKNQNDVYTPLAQLVIDNIDTEGPDKPVIKCTPGESVNVDATDGVTLTIINREENALYQYSLDNKTTWVDYNLEQEMANPLKVYRNGIVWFKGYDDLGNESLEQYNVSNIISDNDPISIPNTGVFLTPEQYAQLETVDTNMVYIVTSDRSVIPSSVVLISKYDYDNLLEIDPNVIYYITEDGSGDPTTLNLENSVAITLEAFNNLSEKPASTIYYIVED
jgi:hypothetical protein